jgi:hypothetical protein
VPVPARGCRLSALPEDDEEEPLLPEYEEPELPEEDEEPLEWCSAPEELEPPPEEPPPRGTAWSCAKRGAAAKARARVAAV